MPSYTANPAANTNIDLLVASSEFYASNVFMCCANSTTADTAFLGIRLAGEATVTWMYNNLGLKSNETFTVTALSLSAGDALVVRSTGGLVHFTVTGEQL